MISIAVFLGLVIEVCAIGISGCLRYVRRKEIGIFVGFSICVFR